MRERHAKGDAKSAGGGEKGIFLAPRGWRGGGGGGEGGFVTVLSPPPPPHPFFFRPLFYVTREFYRFLSPVQTDATLLANNSQHCWMLHVAPVCSPCCMSLRVVGSRVQSLKPVKLLATCKWTQQPPTMLGEPVTLTALVAAFYYCIASWRTVENVAIVGWALKAIHSQIRSYFSY